MGYSSVDITYADMKFRVRITEADGSVSEKDFEVRENAMAWANGQRIRLGLPIIDGQGTNSLREGP